MSAPSLAGNTPADITNCDREPIRIPGAIQPHGFLVALDDEHRVQYASENVREFLDREVGSLMGQNIAAVFEAEVVSALEAALGNPLFARRPMFLAYLRVGPRVHALVAHRCAGRIIVEGELLDGETPAMRPDAPYALDAFLARMETATSLPALLEIAAQETRRMTGFDRVMIYQFDSDWNGVVVAEDRNYHLPSYLDLRFPASDIPRQARELYTINRLRLIAKSDYRPVPIIARDDVRFSSVRL